METGQPFLHGHASKPDDILQSNEQERAALSFSEIVER